MSRLDRHVARVQNKLAVQRFLAALSWTLLVLAGVVLLVVLIDRLLGFAWPKQRLSLLIALGVAVLTAIVWAIVRRPSAHEAAVAIDEKLGLQEKFSTALYVRPLKDPFAAAAVRDAETTADNVSLHKRFPLQWPKIAGWTVLVMLTASFTAYLLKPMDLFGQSAKREERRRAEIQQQAAKKLIEDAIIQVNSVARTFPKDEGIQLTKAKLEEMVNKPMTDPAKAARSAAEALSNLDQQIKQQIAQSKSGQQAVADNKLIQQMQAPSIDEKGPVADAHREIAKGNFDEAVNQLKQTVEKFDKMTEEEKKKAAEQMQNLARQLQQAAANPQQQKQVQQQLQQMGANQQQAQQMQQLMQQAAQGNQQAAQQLQQMAQQMQQQMNNGQGATPQQKAAMQQMVQQMQAQANSGQTAQQMAQAAQQMAQAMQQQAGQGQPGNQGQAGNNPQQMANAAQQLQQQLGQMQAIASDAAQQQAMQNAAQNAAQQAAQQAAGQNPGQGQNGQGNQAGQGGGQNQAQGNQPGQGQGQNGTWQQGDPNQGGKVGQGFGAAGQAAGGSPGKTEAPYDIKQEIGNVQTIDDGKILASTFVKGGSIRGESKATLQQVVQSAEREQTDDVDTDRISGEAKKAVKDYFGQLSGESPKN